MKSRLFRLHMFIPFFEGLLGLGDILFYPVESVSVFFHRSLHPNGVFNLSVFIHFIGARGSVVG
jgi:hypothetical protein